MPVLVEAEAAPNVPAVAAVYCCWTSSVTPGSQAGAKNEKEKHYELPFHSSMYPGSKTRL